MDHCGGGDGGGLVSVGTVDGDVERLIGYLPEQGARGLPMVSGRSPRLAVRGT